MKLNELEVGSNVDITASSEGQKLIFHTTIAVVDEEIVLVEAILEDEKTVGFKGVNSSVVAIFEGETPVLFTDVEIKLVKYKGGVYHQLICAKEGGKYNRRRDFRCFLGVPGKYNSSEESFDVTVKDIAAHGVAFVCANDSLEIGRPAAVSFEYNELPIVLRGTLVRKMEVENGKVVYAIEFKAANHKLEKIVNEKQRADLAKKNASNKKHGEGGGIKRGKEEESLKQLSEGFK
ncbi:MAG: PilZ domain-containing protein [Lachnospiraceae bacterium]|nr:PilZ domain-containing protein [Lachnospiraceae bacterium]